MRCRERCAFLKIVFAHTPPPKFTGSTGAILLRKFFVNLIDTEQPIDTSTAAGKAFLDMLGVFAEFETNLRKERAARGYRQG
jgi:hypothetical protein